MVDIRAHAEGHHTPHVSAASERAFSVGGRVVTKHRNRLGGERVADIVFLHESMKHDIYLVDNDVCRAPSTKYRLQGPGGDELSDANGSISYRVVCTPLCRHHGFHVSTYSGLGLCGTTRAVQSLLIGRIHIYGVRRQNDQIHYLEEAYNHTRVRVCIYLRRYVAVSDT